MASCKHLTFSFILFSIAILIVVTNHLYFTINYSRHMQEEAHDVKTLIRNPNRLEANVSKDKRTNVGSVQNTDPTWFEVVLREFKTERINMGLVNMEEMIMDGIRTKAKMMKVAFDRVGEEIQWSDLVPEWMSENSTCPDIPMPRFEDYRDVDVVVARIEEDDGGMKDVFRVQVNLVVANLLVRSGRKGSNGPLMAVFVGSFEPMWEIFRCDDIFWNEANTWIYKPQLTRIKKLLLMPLGACQFVPPFSHFGDQEQWNKQTNDHNHHHQQKEAYVTVLHTSEDYVCGAIVLAQSLILSNTTKDLILLADDNISPESMEGLQAAGWKTGRIERIRSAYSRKDSYNEWNYSKLRIWQLKHYKKVMFIDADLIVNRNIDSFFVYPQLSAVGNYQKHLFNSGLMVVEPSQCTFETLMRKMMVVESYNGGDQGFLNEMFVWWHRLPHELNFMKVFVDENDKQHLVEEDVYVLHYTGLKPWKCWDKERDCNWDVPEFHRYASDSAHRMWWRVYETMPEKLRSLCSHNRYTPVNAIAMEIS